MPKLTLYTKPDCCLCDEARDALDRVRARVAFELDVIDVSTDAKLGEHYGERIPVVLVDGREAFEYTVDEDELESRLGARTGAAS
jgi:glutaredoxin